MEDQLVAVINVDGAIAGNYTLMATSSPMLRGTIMNATKLLHPPDPTAQELEDHTSLYQQWATRMPDDNDKSNPKYVTSYAFPD